MLSETEKQKIQKEARELLGKFGEALENIKEEDSSNERAEESGGFREEKEGLKGDEDFKKRMLANAPKKNDDCIIAEKGKW